MIDETLVDCYNDSEMVTAMLTAIPDYLDLPSATSVLGSYVDVVALESGDTGEIVAICKRNDKDQRILLRDLPLPDPLPSRSEWIAGTGVSPGIHSFGDTNNDCWEVDVVSGCSSTSI